ncbi:MAG: bifunctional phosphopantothenoylcysteine decarboxylase/phosphopantothenate--cysteine ligase CoaBC [Acidimicrobiales bacterium]
MGSDRAWSQGFDGSDELAGRRIVLGVCGGIAAYKAVELCRRLFDAGAHVIPVMTKGATRFVGEVTFSALASEPVRLSLWDEAEPIPHTYLGQTADLVVVAPATARLIGAYAAGISSDLLTATLLATRAPVVLCPAMHTEMWEHPAVADNLATLRRRGVSMVEPGRGRLAGGDAGVGRLADVTDIMAAVTAALAASGSGGASRAAAGGGDHGPGDGNLVGLNVLITAGGTREPIDPVRFIGNRSSGKQGYALAGVAARRGAKVTLVTTVERACPAAVDKVMVETAAEMEAAVAEHSDGADIVVMAAAVADFRPTGTVSHKLDKSKGPPPVVLEPTPDILAGLGLRRRPGQVLVGFAAETQDMRNRAANKLAEKGIDLIVANDVSVPGVGFEHDTNAVTIISDDGQSIDIPITDKTAVAEAVLDAAASRLTRRRQ